MHKLCLEIELFCNICSFTVNEWESFHTVTCKLEMEDDHDEKSHMKRQKMYAPCSYHYTIEDYKFLSNILVQVPFTNDLTI
jgi:hypothetical protein